MKKAENEKQEKADGKKAAELAAREAEHEAERLRLEEECRKLREQLAETKGVR